MTARKIPPLPTLRHFARRLLKNSLVSGAVIGSSLSIGAVGYHHFEHQSWLDAFLNASMILTGMGPLDRPATVGGKYFAMAYALFSGVIFLGAAAVLFTPIFHRFLHNFHLDMQE